MNKGKGKGKALHEDDGSEDESMVDAMVVDDVTVDPVNASTPSSSSSGLHSQPCRRPAGTRGGTSHRLPPTARKL